MAKQKKTKNYIDNAVFTQLLGDYVRGGAVNISDDLANMFMLLCKRVLTMPNFAGYSYKDDMYSDAVYDLIRYSKNFNPDRKPANAFSYCTQIAYQSMVRRIKKEKQQHKTKIKIIQNLDLSDISSKIDDDDEFANEYLESIKQMYEDKLPEEPKKETPKPTILDTPITRALGEV